MTDDIIFSDATKLAKLIRTKAVSPVEVVQKHSTGSRLLTQQSTPS